MPARKTGRYERDLVETTGKKRDRNYVYRAYIEGLRTGTELDIRR